MPKLSNLQIKDVAKELTAKAIESKYLPMGRTGTEAAKIVLDFYLGISEKLNDCNTQD